MWTVIFYGMDLKDFATASEMQKQPLLILINY
jgi:hypothetical protein